MEDSYENGMSEKKKGKNLTVIVLVVLLIFSGLLNVMFFFSLVMMGMAGAAGGKLLQEVLVDGDIDAKDKILLMRITGPIVRDDHSSRGGSDIISYVMKRLKKVEEEKEFKGILLVINSPGGGVSESDEIYTAIKDFKRRSGKPVIAYFESIAASGGYYIASAADEIIAQPTTITGSIGVIMSLVHIDGLMEKTGITSTIIVSERTPYKDIGSPFRKMKNEEKKMLQDIIDEMYDRFVDSVAEGRKELDREAVESLATGMVYTGIEAEKNKLVDRVGYFADAAKLIRSSAGADDAKIIELESPPGLLDTLFRLKSTNIDISLFSTEDILKRYNSIPMYMWVPRVMR